jgi:hypothetical protein
VWHQAEGVDWCRNTWPLLQKKIVCLYLDNFYYDWEVERPSPNILKQKQEYRERFGIEITDVEAQEVVTFMDLIELIKKKEAENGSRL